MIEVYVKQFFSTKCSKGDKIVYNENDKCVPSNANYVKFFVAFSPTLFLNFKFQVYRK